MELCVKLTGAAFSCSI